QQTIQAVAAEFEQNLHTIIRKQHKDNCGTTMTCNYDVTNNCSNGSRARALMAPTDGSTSKEQGCVPPPSAKVERLGSDTKPSTRQHEASQCSRPPVFSQ
ncbi:8698_t:CDS:2, partial [Dentiscutata erythropus]